MDQFAIIVDPYLGASLFATELAKRGVTPIAVFSTRAPLDSMAFSAELFGEVHYSEGDIDKLTGVVKDYEPICIVPGNEAGVELAGELTERLLPTQANVPGMSRAQRDKGHQYKALEAAGVPRLRSICSADERETAEWIATSGLGDHKLVVKPPKSAGTDSVFLVPKGGDWRGPFREILGQVNQMGVLNEDVVVMEFAEGPEFMVDTYSADGRHGLVMVSVYGKHNRGNRLGIYDTGETIDHRDPRTAVLFDYTVGILDAVGIRNASAHTEVILTESGPRLVETGSRFSGSCMQLHQQVSTGDCQIGRAVRHYLDGDFTAHYEMITPARTAWLSAHSSGKLANADTLAAIRDLPTFADARLPETGIEVTSTVDIDSSIGWVIQASQDPAAIEADYAKIRELEAALEFVPA